MREPARKRWGNNKKFIGLGALAAAGILGIWQMAPALPKVTSDSVLIDTVKRGEMIRKISGPGVLVAVENRLIPSILPKAQVERVLIQPGSVVKPDTVLLQLSNPLIMQQYDEAKLKLQVALAELEALKERLNDNLLNQESQVATVRSQYEAAKLQVEYESKLIKDFIVSELQHKKSKLTAEQLKTQLEIEIKREQAIPQLNASERSAKAAEISLLQRQMELQEKLVQSLAVKAGIEGIVQEIRVKEGQGVDQGEILALVARQDRLKAEIRVIESQAREVVVGQKVAIDVGNRTEAGTVARVDPSVINGTVIVDVTFDGELPQGARTNLRVNGTIEIDRLKDVLYIAKPAQAQENAQVRLFKVDDSGVATLTEVQLGRTSSSTVEVVGGLLEGNRIVLSDVSELSGVEKFQLK
ncbi:efflux RND transporter periplasmic adaptor subunit [Tahibacter harae]|uniref:HlyD family efflux transporter periplasmic adaptor subunit n=1 Tax=Tahibacter harae TaxID=2963937 RepID=A0ABT1QM49_9GAMM|nr:HlyD family efflux transporter periplasmic adaptor subunit [Tahibacter harae]MCQ4163594.1 HlyD family efflux transporter periplasmic adaptor subunit [Tahibacter harae]